MPEFQVGLWFKSYEGYREVTAAEWKNPNFAQRLVRFYTDFGGLPLLETEENFPNMSSPLRVTGGEVLIGDKSSTVRHPSSDIATAAAVGGKSLPIHGPYKYKAQFKPKWFSEQVRPWNLSEVTNYSLFNVRQCLYDTSAPSLFLSSTTEMRYTVVHYTFCLSLYIFYHYTFCLSQVRYQRPVSFCPRRRRRDRMGRVRLGFKVLTFML